jgi:hypothetical protein
VRPVGSGERGSWQPGDRLAAQILARQGHDRYLADIGGQRWILRIAASHAPGEMVALRVLTAGPRPTLMLENRPLIAGQPVSVVEASAAPADAGPSQRPTAVAADAGTGSAPVFARTPGALRYRSFAELGPGEPLPDPESARLTPFARALGAASAGSSAGFAGATAGSERALLAGTQAPAAEGAAKLLREQIANSGLFYEARLARWAAGQLPFAELARSPQARRDRAPLFADAEARATGAGGQLDGAIASGAADTGGGAAAPLPAGAEQRVAQAQLALLLDGRLEWRGVAWPGQRYSLEVERDETAAPAGSAGVRAKLRVDLPALGPIDFSIVLREERVAIGAEAPGAGTVEALTRAGDELAERLAAANLHVAALHFAERPGGPAV